MNKNLPTPVPRFSLQPTPSFTDGAPERAEYETDFAHEHACSIYAIEWRAIYLCCDTECKNRDCPQHYPDHVSPRDRADLIEMLTDALQANGVFHTPIALRRRGGQWDDYELDAIRRTREALAAASKQC